jgi:SAM-dependent methyltransferase
MTLFGTKSVDAIFSSHNIEHVFPHEVPIVLAEFYRVLKPNGIVVITCPDLQVACEAIAQDKLLEPLYESPAGPISPIDLLYGHRGYIEQENHYVAHKCGFSYYTLGGTFLATGFKEIFGGCNWLCSFKNLCSFTCRSRERFSITACPQRNNCLGTFILMTHCVR